MKIEEVSGVIGAWALKHESKKGLKKPDNHLSLAVHLAVEYDLLKSKQIRAIQDEIHGFAEGSGSLEIDLANPETSDALARRIVENVDGFSLENKKEVA